MGSSASSVYRLPAAFMVEKGILDSTKTMPCTSKSSSCRRTTELTADLLNLSLAIQHALETTSVGDVPIQRFRNPSAAPQNPYILPFAMRGLLEEDYVRTELHDEMRELLKQFEHWKPSSKVLKDVKFRLEGVKFKL